MAKCSKQSEMEAQFMDAVATIGAIIAMRSDDCMRKLNISKEENPEEYNEVLMRVVSTANDIVMDMIKEAMPLDTIAEAVDEHLNGVE